MRVCKTIIAAMAILTASTPYVLAGSYSDTYPQHFSFTRIDARTVVRDAASGNIAHSSSGECVRTQWVNNYDECAPTPQVAAPSVKPMTSMLSREERTVYFGFNQATLSPEMKTRLGMLADVIRSEDSVKGVRIVGYADRIGNPSYNEKLSQKRAENVRQYLEAKGIINANIADTRWLGATASETDCSAKLKHNELIDCLQKDRRVEIEIDYQAEVHASR